MFDRPFGPGGPMGGPGGMGKPGGRPPLNFDKLKEKADANGDGQISKDEFSAAEGPNGKTPTEEMVTRFFGRVDTDGDSIITETEVSAAKEKREAEGGPGMFGGPPPLDFSKLLEKADTDADNQITKTEFEASKGPNGLTVLAEMVKRFFENFDVNDDETVTEDEFNQVKAEREAETDAVEE